MPYQPFPIVEVAVSKLHLDTNNFRIDDVLPSESAAITYLFAEHDIMGLARQILLEGYVDNELLLAVKENNKYVVLEGNRRTTALKALLNPAVAPGHAQAYLETLIRRHEIEAENVPTKVRVMVAPSRAATGMLLARLHIGQSKNGWGRDAQARFVIAQLEAGMSIAMIRQELPGVKNAAGYVRQYHVRQILKEATFTDPKLAKYAAGPKLKMTAFEYAYGNPDIQRVLGLVFDKEGVATSRPTSAQQVRALERLVGLFESNELNTRKFPKRTSDSYDDEMRLLVAKLIDGMGTTSNTPRPDTASDNSSGGSETGRGGEAGSSRAGTEKGSSASTGSGSGQGSGANASPGGGAGRGPNSTDTLKSLHITIDYAHAPIGLRKRLHELRSLDLNTYPVAAAILMRSAVEASIKWHFTSRGTSASGELGSVIREVDKAYYKSHRPLRNVIDLLKDDSAKNLRPGSLRWFNMAAHDANHAMDAQGVRNAWHNVEHFVGFMLTPVASELSA